MDLSKLRRGELIAAIGGIVLLFALWFLNWYDRPLEDLALGAWDKQGFLGTLANLVILAAGLSAVGLAVLTAMSRTVALPVAASALTAPLGMAAVALVLGRMLFQPGPNEIVGLEFGIFVALAGALAVTVGGWQSMQEEGAGGSTSVGRDAGTGPEQGGGFPRSGDGPPGGEPPSTTPASGEGPAIGDGG